MHPNEFAKLKASGGVHKPAPDNAGKAEAPELARTKGPRGPPPTNAEPLLTTVRGARVILGVGNTTVWSLIKARELHTVRFGRRVMITIDLIHAAIARRLAAAQAGKSA